MPMVTSDDIAWPPVYKLRKHRRARHVRFYPSKKHGLEITIPYRFPKRELAALLEEHKAWIIEQLKVIQVEKSEPLPDAIAFPIIEQAWQVRYLRTQKRMRIVESPMHILSIFGDIDDREQLHKRLISWFKSKAKIYVLALLDEVSQETQLPFKSATIRDQKTQWGSCSADRVINLNYRLIFLPRELVRHIMVHELCHTVHLNHSSEFWDLVAKHDDNWMANRRALRHADKYLPGWL